MPDPTSPSHRQLVEATAGWLLSQSTIQLVSWEMHYGKSVFDVIGVSLKKKKNTSNRITAIECKVSRADLIQDLKKGKLLKYEAQSTHCYLSITPECLLNHSIQDLSNKGLPGHWGILLYTQGHIQVMRGARSHRTTTQNQIEAIRNRIGKSCMYRLMNLLNIIEPY